jgi:4-amino-4-deoxy-L-arabinose transferase-like glycosyltransferase
MPSALRLLRDRPAWVLAALALLLHLYASGGYGVFRDELYFIVCGSRLDWGYVDQPPLIPLIAWTMHTLFPASLVMQRLVPALAHAGTIALTGEMARALGARVWGQGLAALCVLVAGVYLGMGTLLSTDALQPLAWSFCSYALIRVIRERDERWWLAMGSVVGVALLSKYMIVFWLAALGLGIVTTPARRSLARPPLYAGAAIALLIVLPNVLWQWAHDWPFLEIGRRAAEGKNVALSPLAFLAAEIENLNPGTAPVWLIGVAAFAFWRRLADLRLFAIAFIALVAVMIAVHAKPYYPVGAYTVLFAGGATALEAWLSRPAPRAALAAAVALLGVVLAPFALPILPVARFAAYEERLGQSPKPLERLAVGRLPQYYADMFGWSELAALVGRAYQALPAEERAQAVFLARNYGEAAAVDVLGTAWGLPPAISGHNSYFLWGPRGHDGSVVLLLGGEREALLRTYESVEAAGMTENPWAMPFETGLTLWICRGRHPPLDVAWPGLKNYI